MRIVYKIIQALRGSATYNPDVQEAPACILWPDRDRQWEAVIPRLQNELPELLLLGDYQPDKRIGPAIWLRCVIAGKNEDVVIPGSTPSNFVSSWCKPPGFASGGKLPGTSQSRWPNYNTGESYGTKLTRKTGPYWLF